MEVEMRVKLLKQKRTTLKVQLTSVNNFIEKNRENLDLVHLQLRSNKLNDLFDNFDEVHNELQIYDPEENHNTEKENIEDNYFELASKIQKLLNPLNATSNVPLANSTVCSEVNRSANNKRPVKLPPISIPSFSGTYEEWPSFYNSFKSLIHDQTDISNVDKLHYLKTSLSGDAHQKLEIFSLTNENYIEAWEFLKKFYDNKRLIISRHLTLLLELKHVERENREDLLKLADHVQQHLNCLKNLGVDYTNHSEFVVRIIEQRLPKNIFRKWDETLTKDAYPKLSQIIQLIYDTAARITNQDSFRSTFVSQERSRTFHEPPSKRKKFNNKNETFLTTVNSKATNVKELKCKICSGDHQRIYKCNKFREMSVDARIKKVSELGLCKNCLRSHSGKECTFGNCVICNKRHNT